MEEDVGDPVTCTGKSCQSCTAGVIADCVAMCCCPCAVVNILALAFFKLPYAMARKCIRRRKRQRIAEERKKCGREDFKVISGNVEGIIGNLDMEIVGNDIFSAEFDDNSKVEEVWLELYDIGHLGFGRVSFTGLPFHNRGN